jgi:hypothetical protein
MEEDLKLLGKLKASYSSSADAEVARAIEQLHEEIALMCQRREEDIKATVQGKPLGLARLCFKVVIMKN